MPTRREKLAHMLTFREWGVKGLAREMQMTVSDVLDDLEHVRKSNRETFCLTPARCRACGFTFESRDRLSTPSRCPECREERVVGPWVSIKT